ncbi:MBL fold metallo-hydrolase [Adhaeretor mobilis]|uniref:Ribonuclease Z n=1 Tax=Adhaeretor mobilis TaxID=1930276 RepID=A0A517MR87_9BACT|nr:MBL fold metallo-hydrolase [Adhaeretor mobilis]QDS97392.1 ribonuclease Z [Adhaeretor mobilis]
MVDNAPLISHTHGELTVEGYSRAAVQTYWRIPELKLGFDLGAHPWSFMGTDTWFVSHAHLDHIAALPLYVARRRMMKMSPPTIYMPPEAIEPSREMLKQFTRLDRGRMPCEILPIYAGAEIELSRELVVTVSETKHSVASCGFVVWQRRNKLKAEYVDLSGDQIRDLRTSGTEITEELRTPLVAYTGDTAPVGLDRCPAMYEAKILITELTFVSPEHRKEKIHKFGHMHLDDYVDRRDKFNNELIIAGHLSTRYHPNKVRRMVENALPGMLDGRLKLWL